MIRTVVRIDDDDDEEEKKGEMVEDYDDTVTISPADALLG